MTNKLKYTELRSLDSTIEQLQELVDGLRSGVLRLASGERQLLLSPGAVLDFSLCAEQKGVQERLELALEWRRQDLTISSGLPGVGIASRPEGIPAPAARTLALQAESELEDDLEPPVSYDDDDTLGPEEPSVAVYDDDLIDPEDLDEAPLTVRHSSPPGGQLSASRRAVDSDPELLERMYGEARTPASDGRLRLDEKRFVEALVAAGLEPQLQQELHNLARQADAEGRDRLFNERSISDMIDSSLRGVA